MTPVRTAALSIAMTALAASGTAFAADLGLETVQPEGVPCGSAVVQTFPSVWLGHFSGGRSYYPGPGSAIVLDWRDEKLCFPGRRSCNLFIQEMRRAFHRPEGYFTCLPIR